MNKKFFILIGVLLMIFSNVHAAGISIQDNRATADYWTGKNPSGETKIEKNDLEMFNLQIRQKSPSMVDLAKYPEKFSSQTLREKITAAMTRGKFQGTEIPKLFKNGAGLTEFSFTHAKANCNLEALPENCTVRYGLTIRRANLRFLPETEGWFESKTDTHYDQLQATALDPGEPVAVLVESKDKKFVFVDSRTYAGWLDVSTLAFADRPTWLKYVSPQNYLTVIASRKTIPQGASLFQMGAKVLLRAADVQKDGSWAISIPNVDANGTIVEQALNVPKDNGTVKSALPCTENNLIRQAFRFLGEAYGWGGLEDGVDCSAFVQDVYRSVGIELPRDADRQAKAMPRSVSLEGMNREQRLAIIKKSKPGSLLFSKSHVMIYLGTDDKGEPIVIHALSSYFTFGEQTAKHYVRKVIVTDLHFMNSNKVEMIDNLTSVGSL